MSMAREENKLKMKVLKLKEWKLIQQCDKMGHLHTTLTRTIAVPCNFVNFEIIMS